MLTFSYWGQVSSPRWCFDSSLGVIVMIENKLLGVGMAADKVGNQLLPGFDNKISLELLVRHAVVSST